VSDPEGALAIQRASLLEGWSVDDYMSSQGKSYPVTLTLSRQPSQAEIVIFELSHDEDFPMEGADVAAQLDCGWP
jgi:hypothetical protein